MLANEHVKPSSHETRGTHFTPGTWSWFKVSLPDTLGSGHSSRASSVPRGPIPPPCWTNAFSLSTHCPHVWGWGGGRCLNPPVLSKGRESILCVGLALSPLPRSGGNTPQRLVQEVDCCWSYSGDGQHLLDTHCAPVNHFTCIIVPSTDIDTIIALTVLTVTP